MKKIKIGKILKFIWITTKLLLLGFVIAFALAIIPQSKNGHWFFWQWSWPLAVGYVVTFLFFFTIAIVIVYIVKDLNKEELPTPYPEE